jgi:hypothetical protein
MCENMLVPEACSQETWRMPFILGPALTPVSLRDRRRFHSLNRDRSLGKCTSKRECGFHLLGILGASASPVDGVKVVEKCFLFQGLLLSSKGIRNTLPPCDQAQAFLRGNRRGAGSRRRRGKEDEPFSPGCIHALTLLPLSYLCDVVASRNNFRSFGFML